MKKKFLSLLMVCAVLMFNLTSYAAKIGDVIGTVYHTDIVAYINNYAVPSYAANGTSVIVAEDLRNFGFDVVWDANARTLSISRNQNTQPAEMQVKKTGTPSSKFSNLLYTDIKVYANGVQIPSYAINGYTMIPLESLTMFGECNWVSEQRAVKLWIEGVHMRSEMQSVKQYIGDLKGVWRSTSNPTNHEIIVYGQLDDKIHLAIISILGEGRKIATDDITYVKITNGTGTFSFSDSFGFKGTGTITFNGGSMNVSYKVTKSGFGYSITAGSGTYYKTNESVTTELRAWNDCL